MDQNIYDMIEANPVIAAVKDETALERCCEMREIRVVFTLFGDICSIPGIVHRLKKAGKIVFVHTDLVAGLASKDVAADFVHQNTEADGLISTKPGIIRRARELGLATVLRIFLLDSMAVENLPNQMANAKPDMLELLPGIIPRVIHRVKNIVRTPVIAGGLISTKEDVMEALDAGAISVSATSQKIWVM